MGPHTEELNKDEIVLCEVCSDWPLYYCERHLGIIVDYAKNLLQNQSGFYDYDFKSALHWRTDGAYKELCINERCSGTNEEGLEFVRAYLEGFVWGLSYVDCSSL